MALFNNPLWVTLGLRTKGFEKGLDKAKKRVNGFESGLRRTGRSMLKYAAAGVAVRSVTNQVIQSFERVDQIDKVARRFGVTTDAVQVYTQAAALAGVETSTLIMGMQRMGRRLSEAANGTGEARDALKELGINAKEFANLPLDEAFERIGNEIRKVANANRQLALTQKIVDSEGVKVLQLWKDSSISLRELRSEMGRLGLVLSTEQINKMVAAKDAVTEATMAWRNFIDSLVSEVAPGIAMVTAGLEKVFGFLSAIGRFQGNVIGRLFSFGTTGSFTPGNLGALARPTGSNADMVAAIQELTGVVDRRLKPGAQ